MVSKGKKTALCIVILLLVTGIALIIYGIWINNTDGSDGIDKDGATLSERFTLPEGYTRVTPDVGSYAEFLQNIKLKTFGEPAYHYNGSRNFKAPLGGVFDMLISQEDLEQCADSCMRLYAEYLYAAERYSEITFTGVSGYVFSFDDWREGRKPVLQGDSFIAEDTGEKDSSYESFRDYMDTVHKYCNTASLQKQLSTVSAANMEIGDMFIATATDQGTDYGHAVTIVDMCINEEGAKLILVAESTMPASQTYVCRNADGAHGGYWIEIGSDGVLHTESWSCPIEFLRTYRIE